MKRSKPNVKLAVLLTTLAFVSLAGAASAQTAREYFDELRDAHAFTHYGDEYVCFPDKDEGSFDVIARSKDIETTIAQNGKDGKKSPSAGDVLIVSKYFKGVTSRRHVLEKVDKDSDTTWSVGFISPMAGKMVYRINWLTGRYQLQVYVWKYSKVVPTDDGSGKCELIHPWSPPESDFDPDKIISNSKQR